MELCETFNIQNEPPNIFLKAKDKSKYFTDWISHTETARENLWLDSRFV